MIRHTFFLGYLAIPRTWFRCGLDHVCLFLGALTTTGVHRSFGLGIPDKEVH